MIWKIQLLILLTHEATKKRGSILEVLKHGIEISNHKIKVYVY